MLFRSIASSARVTLSANTENVPTLLKGFDLLVYSIANLGESELHARSLDRSLALDVFADRQPWLAEKVNQLNESGIVQLEKFREILPEIQREMDKIELSQSVMDKAKPIIIKNFKEQIGDLEIKGSDAKKLMDVVSGIMDELESRGIKGMLKHVDKNIKGLISIRREPDRGARDNIPVWKAMTLVAIIGVFILVAFVHAIINNDFTTIFVIISWVLTVTSAFLVILFC